MLSSGASVIVSGTGSNCVSTNPRVFFPEAFNTSTAIWLVSAWWCKSSKALDWKKSVVVDGVDADVGSLVCNDSSSAFRVSGGAVVDNSIRLSYAIAMSTDTSHSFIV